MRCAIIPTGSMQLHNCQVREPLPYLIPIINLWMDEYILVHRKCDQISTVKY